MYSILHRHLANLGVRKFSGRVSYSLFSIPAFSVWNALLQVFDLPGRGVKEWQACRHTDLRHSMRFASLVLSRWS